MEGGYVVWVGGRLRLRNICPFKGISSLVCSESTPGVSALHWQSERWHASQNRAEEGGAESLVQAQSPISQSSTCSQSHLTPDNSYMYCGLGLLNRKHPTDLCQGKKRSKIRATFLRCKRRNDSSNQELTLDYLLEVLSSNYLFAVKKTDYYYYFLR